MPGWPPASTAGGSTSVPIPSPRPAQPPGRRAFSPPPSRAHRPAVPPTRRRGRVTEEMAGPSDRSARRVPPGRPWVGCRPRAAKSSLLRLVVAGDVIVPAPAARLPGRGAYLHPSQGCFELAQRRRAVVRALHAPGPLRTARVVEDLAPPGTQV